MPTLKGEISRPESGRLQEQLSGRVWLGQKKGEWPVAVLTSESNVAYFLQDPDAVVWEYDIDPIRRVQVVRPEPYITGFQDE